METRDIIVIGASAGGFEALKRLVADLPPTLAASIFVVWHMSPDIRGVLPQVLNRANTLHAAHAIEGEAIVRGRIYVAPPDHHLLIERGRVRVMKGPKEHRFRPAVDPLFRSAAAAYGPRVIGVVLSGALDDGTAGLWTIKQHGGMAVVQDPRDADVSSMPENAMRNVAVDAVVPIAGMADVLVRLSHAPAASAPELAMEDIKKTEIEIRIAAQENALEAGVLELGVPTHYTCPSCHGTLAALQDGTIRRFRCHTGHAFSADSLLAAISENIEDQLWNALRTVEESVLLLNQLGDHCAENNQIKRAALYFQKANEATTRAGLVRQAVMQHEYLSDDSVQQAVEETE